MHLAASRVLFIPELQNLIFEHLRQPTASNLYSSSLDCLTSIALAHTQFTETALSIRWANVLDVTRIARVWLCSKVLGHDFVKKPLREPDTADWRRLHYYLKRIKTLVVDLSLFTPRNASFITDFLIQIFNTDLRSLDIKRPRASGPRELSLTPMLTDLTWVSCGEEDMLVCTAALLEQGRRITRFSLGKRTNLSLGKRTNLRAGEGMAKSILEIMDSLQSHRQTLRTLLVREHLKESQDAVFDLVQESLNLTEIAIPTYTVRCSRSLDILARHPALQVLELGSPLIDLRSEWVPAPLVPNAFTQLHTLRVEGPVALEKVNFRLPYLRKLIVEGNMAVLAEDVSAALSRIAKYFNSIEELCLRLTLHVSSYNSDMTPAYSDAPFILLLLLPCVLLKRLRVQLQTPQHQNHVVSRSQFDAVDDDWIALAAKMTELESLCFSCGPTVDPDYAYHTPANTAKPRATLHSLISLLQLPKPIRHLNIPLNITPKGFAACQGEISSLKRHDCVRWLEFWRCWLDKEAVNEMAKLLGKLRPVKWVVPRTVPMEKRNSLQAVLFDRPSRDEIDRCSAWDIVNGMEKGDQANEPEGMFVEVLECWKAAKFR
ncbi:hypothetical protein FRC00_009160 [Tulasnella sp. 408]|nr:hypothetical protein FRC00_009160 [Tulasnella sp. 408]